MKYVFIPGFKDQYLAIISVWVRDPIRILIALFFPAMSLALIGLIFWAGRSPTPYEYFLLMAGMTAVPLLLALSLWDARRKNHLSREAMELEFSESGIKVTHALFNLELKWGAIIRVLETPRFFLFFSSPRTAHLLLKSAVGSQEEIQKLRVFIEQHLNEAKDTILNSGPVLGTQQFPPRSTLSVKRNMLNFLGYTFILVAVVYLGWYVLFGKTQTGVFPEIDPQRFFEILSDIPRIDTPIKGQASVFSEHGYMQGEEGIKASFANTWSKRSMRDEYDFDLEINVICSSSISKAKEIFAREAQKFMRMKDHAKEISITPSLSADAAGLYRLELKSAPAIYVFDARYGNYIFKFVARIQQGGAFETEMNLLSRLRALDAHIRQVLNSAA